MLSNILDAGNVYAHHMVRTDSRTQKLDAFLQRGSSVTKCQLSTDEQDMETSTDDNQDVVAIATTSSGDSSRFGHKCFIFSPVLQNV